MIITFYSYKGGVGRSMALANIAALMSQAELRVVMVDWDLEAPGLERFFPQSEGKSKTHQNKGVIDLLLDYMHKAERYQPGQELLTADELRQYLVSFPSIPNDSDAPTEGSLSLFPAGKREDGKLADYANRVKTFDWKDFYETWEGERYFELLRQRLLEVADVVLIDARTGLSEMGGVCTYQLADLVVVLCAPNIQNLEGTRQMVETFVDPKLTAMRHGRPLRTIIVPARVERTAELSQLNLFREKFREQFFRYYPPELFSAVNDIPPNISYENLNHLRFEGRENSSRSIRRKEDSPNDLLIKLEIPYVPIYSFEERIAVQQMNTPHHSVELVKAYKSLLQAITRLAPPSSKLARRIPLEKFENPSIGNASSRAEKIFARKLGVGDVVELAHEFRLQAYEIDKMLLSEKPGLHLLVWLKEANMLHKLPRALYRIGRRDLVALAEVFLSEQMPEDGLIAESDAAPLSF